MTTQPRAAIYARYSTDKQRAESLEDQYHQCEKVAAREGFKVVAKFGDKEISGGTADRPGYQNMLEAARAGKFDILISEDVSRLWRNRAEFGSRSAELQDLGIHWLSCLGQDTRREGWGLMIQILQAMAEHARLEASYRTRRGLDGLARAGKHAGGKAYGYTSVNKVRTVDPEQAKVVLQIFKWRAAGWSCQRIARKLNEDRVPSPGSTWNRVSSGPTRKTKKGWRPSAIAGDVTRSVGILNNPMYKGQVVWGRSKWTRQATNSDKRKVSKVNASEWIVHNVPDLQIVPTELWEQVHAIQTASNPRRDAVRRGVIKGRNGPMKRVGGRDSRYWLGTLLVCTCGANYIGDGLRDYVCPAHTSNSCDNDMRFRRADAHTALFDLLRKEMLNAQGVRTAEAFIKQQLLDQVRQEERAARDAASGADTKRLDQELRELRKMRLRPAAMAAAVEEIERERAELLARAVGKQDKRESRAKAMLARLPEIVTQYKDQIRDALKTLTDERVVDDAREATRRLLIDGRIVLAPTPTRTAVTGPVQLVGLGAHVLQLAGWQRQARAAGTCKLSGSGGRI
jgi:DNA invertase Pin-like site-specific DNA recombinase